MKSELLKIQNIKDTLGLENYNQALYLLGLHYNIQIEISLDDLGFLTSEKIVTGDTMSAGTSIVVEKAIRNLPQRTRKLTADTVDKHTLKMDERSKTYCKYLMAKLVPKDIDISEYSTLLGIDSVTPTVWFILFMYIWPSKTDNANWDLYFGTTYKGVPLRLRSKHTSEMFKALYAKYDMSKVIIGASLMMKQCVDTEKGVTFIKKMSTFIDEVDHWIKQSDIFLDKRDKAIAAKEQAKLRISNLSDDDNSVEI